MKYPNLRYGNPVELEFYMLGSTIKQIARQLRRSEKSVKNWLDRKQKVPFWVTELLRLQAMEKTEMLRQMNLPGMKTKLGLIAPTGKIIELDINFSGPKKAKPQTHAQQQLAITVSC